MMVRRWRGYDIIIPGFKRDYINQPISGTTFFCASGINYFRVLLRISGYRRRHFLKGMFLCIPALNSGTVPSNPPPLYCWIKIHRIVFMLHFLQDI